MSLPQICIKRPAFAIVLSLIILLVGIMSYTTLGVRWIPNVKPPIVSVQISYPGASAQLVETQIISPVEDALAGVGGIETSESHSKLGNAYVQIVLKPDIDVNTAVEEVRSSIERVRNKLPKNIQPPVIRKLDPNAHPILYLGFTATNKSQKEISDYVQRFIMPDIESANGVGSVHNFGDRNVAMRIWLDPAKMAARGVTVDDVMDTLEQQNVSVPSGQIRSKDRYYTVITDAKLASPRDFNHLILRDDHGKVVRLSDVGRAVIGSEKIDTAFRFNHKSAIALGVIPQSTANPLGVTSGVLKLFKEIKANLPPGMNAHVIYNQSKFTRASIDSVYHTIGEAIVLVLLVVFVFLGTWRATIIPIITVPVCLIGAFSVMHFLGYTINTITLLALVLAIGLVVDDAIVMLENIARHVEEGVPPLQAAMQGSKEMIFPIIGMTLTLAAVYAPIGFIQGITGQFFREFAYTLAGAVLISGFVALTLSPMMCSLMLKKIDLDTGYAGFLEKISHAAIAGYQRILHGFLSKRVLVVFILLLVGVGGYFTFHSLPSELAPNEDMGYINVFMKGSRDASFEYTNKYAKQLENIYSSLPEESSYLVDLGFGAPSRGFSMIKLKDRDKREKSAAEVAEDLREKVKSVSGIRAMPSAPPSPLTWFSSDSGGSFGVVVMSAGSYESLYSVMKNLKKAVSKNPGIINVDTKLKWDTTQFSVTIDRAKAADLKVPLKDVTQTISTLLAGTNMTKYRFGGKEYDVTVQMDRDKMTTPDVINNFYVKNDDGKMVPLSALVTIKSMAKPYELPHYNHMRADFLTANLAEGYTIQEAIKFFAAYDRNGVARQCKICFCW